MRLRTAASEAALLFGALIWGFAFAAQKDGSAAVPPLVFVATRCLIGALSLVPVIAVLDRVGGRRISLWGGADRRTLLGSGIVCGVLLMAASVLQQYGIGGTTSGKAGFLTSLYMVLVPIFGIFCGRKTCRVLWIATAAAMGGVWLLSAADGWRLNICDWLLIGCAALFAVHILVVDRVAPVTDCLRLACLQFFWSGVLALALSLMLGVPWQMAALTDAAVPLLYCGLCSTGLGFTLQIVGQKYLHPVTATLIMSLESVFAVLGGWLCLGETLTGREMAGCGVIFAAVLLAQIPVGNSRADQAGDDRSSVHSRPSRASSSPASGGPSDRCG